MQGRQGAGRVQGQGTEGRAGLQDSILRFSRPENLKITFLQLFEKKGEAGRRQGAGAGHRGQGRVARFHFQGLKTSKSRFCNFLRRQGKGGQGRVWVQSV